MDLKNIERAEGLFQRLEDEQRDLDTLKDNIPMHVKIVSHYGNKEVDVVCHWSNEDVRKFIYSQISRLEKEIQITQNLISEL